MLRISSSDFVRPSGECASLSNILRLSHRRIAASGSATVPPEGVLALSTLAASVPEQMPRHLPYRI